ncbi:MAG: hypothetical protein RL710_2711 [Pseudomonadota bacterium]|jgi:hypothetical protein
MKTSRALRILAGIAIVFGALTVFSGGRALFGSEEARASVGNAVDFVLWFNFSAGFFYVLAGAGLWLGQRWAVWAALALAGSTALVALALGFHVMGGSAYEMRTVGAMALRLSFWMALALVALRSLNEGKVFHPA